MAEGEGQPIVAMTVEHFRNMEITKSLEESAQMSNETVPGGRYLQHDGSGGFIVVDANGNVIEDAKGNPVTPKQSEAEVEALRARIAELEAERAAGSTGGSDDDPAVVASREVVVARYMERTQNELREDAEGRTPPVPMTGIKNKGDLAEALADDDARRAGVM
jgi:hypothetical protein